jgi:hypothetical protein
MKKLSFPPMVGRNCLNNLFTKGWFAPLHFIKACGMVTWGGINYDLQEGPFNSQA